MPEDRDAGRLLAEIWGVARRAGLIVMDHYEGDIEVGEKADKSPVTAADLASEQVIVRALKAISPDTPVVSEEMVEAGEGPGGIGDRFWLVDPLDGTKEFIGGNGEFTVNIALIASGHPVLGLVHVPALDRTYGGSADGMVLRSTGIEAPEPIGCRLPPKDGLTAMVSRSHGDEAANDAFFKAAGLRIAERVPAGSSLKFCRIAEGQADVYPRLGTTMEWDTAAGHAILAAAGGRVTDVDGGQLTYGKPGFKNPHFVAWGPSAG